MVSLVNRTNTSTQASSSLISSSESSTQRDKPEIIGFNYSVISERHSTAVHDKVQKLGPHNDDYDSKIILKRPQWQRPAHSHESTVCSCSSISNSTPDSELMSDSSEPIPIKPSEHKRSSEATCLWIRALTFLRTQVSSIHIFAASYIDELNVPDGPRKQDKQQPHVFLVDRVEEWVCSWRGSISTDSSSSRRASDCRASLDSVSSISIEREQTKQIWHHFAVIILYSSMLLMSSTALLVTWKRLFYINGNSGGDGDFSLLVPPGQLSQSQIEENLEFLFGDIDPDMYEFEEEVIERRFVDYFDDETQEVKRMYYNDQETKEPKRVTFSPHKIMFEKRTSEPSLDEIDSGNVDQYRVKDYHFDAGMEDYKPLEWTEDARPMIPGHDDAVPTASSLEIMTENEWSDVSEEQEKLETTSIPGIDLTSLARGGEVDGDAGTQVVGKEYNAKNMDGISVGEESSSAELPEILDQPKTPQPTPEELQQPLLPLPLKTLTDAHLDGDSLKYKANEKERNINRGHDDMSDNENDPDSMTMPTEEVIPALADPDREILPIVNTTLSNATDAQPTAKLVQFEDLRRGINPPQPKPSKTTADIVKSILSRPVTPSPDEMANLKTDERFLNRLARHQNGTEIPTKKFPKMIIFGAKKCGTTALKMFLSHHPQFRDKPGERHFFNRQDNWKRGLEHYLSQMEATFNDEINFEKTPDYFDRYMVPERVKQMNESVKLVAVLCDPVERALSHYHHILNVQNGATGANSAYNKLTALKTFPSLVDDSLHRIIGTRNLTNLSSDLIKSKAEDYQHKETELKKRPVVQAPDFILTAGLYSTHLSKWYQHFPAHQIHLINGKQLVENPAEVITSLVQSMHADTRYLGPDNFQYNEAQGFSCIKTDGAGKEFCVGEHSKHGRSRKVDDRRPSFSDTEDGELLEARNKLRVFYEPFLEELERMTGRKDFRESWI